MAYTSGFGTRHRDVLYSLAKARARLAGRGEFPICPLCDLPVTPDQDWDAVDPGAARCKSEPSKSRSSKSCPSKSCPSKSCPSKSRPSQAVGHRRCNAQANPALGKSATDKADRVRKRHAGITGPGLGAHPLPCGRRDRLRRTMRGRVLPRRTLAEKHREFLVRRDVVEVEAPTEPLKMEPFEAEPLEAEPFEAQP
jgi:hypothetical protein